VTRFATTSWTLILRAASEDDAEAQLALAVLCEMYWYPIYAYVRRLGASAADAEDMTQAYFARFLEKQVVRSVHPDRGRFRSFLFVSVRNFFNNERDRWRASKREGSRRLVSLDVATAEEQFKAHLHRDASPETLFVRTWAETLLERVHRRLEDEASRRGNRERVRALRACLPPAEREPDYAAIAKAWGVKPGAVRVALHRLRGRFGEILREEVGRTVEAQADVEDEGRHLLRALGS